ncbi:hypothetical protein [Micromonospora chersina]|uniref:hypothetical protein n=1 Tax=Micromonospora chersina TaxID=47854 RepID=UPI003719DB76
MSLTTVREALPATTASALGWRVAAAVGAAVGAVVHVQAAYDHADHGGRYVAFFIAVATAQLILAVQLRSRPSPALVLAGVVGSVALVGAYVLQQKGVLQLTGGHHAEADGGNLGLLAVFAELVTIAALPRLVEGWWRSSAVNVALAGGVGLWAVWLGVVGG